MSASRATRGYKPLAYKYFLPYGGAQRREMVSKWLDTVTAGMTDQQVVELVDRRYNGMEKLARTTLSRMRNKHSDTSDDTLEIIAAAFRVDIPEAATDVPPSRVSEGGAPYSSGAGPQLAAYELAQRIIEDPEHLTRQMKKQLDAGARIQHVENWLKDLQALLGDRFSNLFAAALQELRARREAGGATPGGGV
jgi:hypothetical protein